MDWLKDKKNLPIVVGLAVFVLLAAGGLVAFETGLIGGPAPPAEVAGPVPPAGGVVPGAPPSPAPGTSGIGRPGRPPAARTAAAVPAVPVAPKLVNPAKGPDPFNIPGWQKRLALQTNGAGNSPSGLKTYLRDQLPVFDIFTYRPPEPPTPVPGQVPDSSAQTSIYKFIGFVNDTEGSILGVLETSGQSQTVKPGDSLPDGGKVISIQTTSITLRTPGGSTVGIPLSSGAGAANQNGQDPNAGNFPNAPGQPFGL